MAQPDERSPEAQADGFVGEAKLSAQLTQGAGRLIPKAIVGDHHLAKGCRQAPDQSVESRDPLGLEQRLVRLVLDIGWRIDCRRGIGGFGLAHRPPDLALDGGPGVGGEGEGSIGIIAYESMPETDTPRPT